MPKYKLQPTAKYKKDVKTLSVRQEAVQYKLEYMPAARQDIVKRTVLTNKGFNVSHTVLF